MKNAANKRFFSHKALFRTAAVLLVLTLFSVCLVCGLFAKYTSRGQNIQSATVAAMGGVTISEHKAVLETDPDKMAENNSAYTLNKKVTVSSNTYYAVPGASIPKDPFITLNGNNDTACELYIEVADGSGGCAEYELSDDWTAVTDGEFSPRHGGTVYKYSSVISPHKKMTITQIIKSDSITITENYCDITDTDKNADGFSVDFYAYLIQTD